MGSERRAKNLTTDIKDSEIYTDLLHQIAPKDAGVNKTAMQKSDLVERAGVMLDQAEKFDCKLVGIGGSDLKEGHQMFTLAFVWQLMRAYTLSLLAKLSADGKPIKEAEIIEWTNNKLSEGGKSTQIRDFKDKANRTALPIIDIVDIMKPGTINYEFVKTGSSLSDEDCFSNAKYAVNMARKIGAPVYALPEDISEVNDKMVMTVYASLMLADAEAKKE